MWMRFWWVPGSSSDQANHLLITHNRKTAARYPLAAVLLAATLLVLGGCGGKPFSPEKVGEVKPGPGLFTGKTGGINILPKSP